MYSKYFLKIIKLYTTFPCILGISSIHFDVKTATYYTTKFSKWKLFFVSLIYYGMTIFMVLRTTQIFMYQGGPSNLYFHISYAFAFAFVLESAFLTFQNIKGDEICCVFTQMTRYYGSFRDKWIINYNPKDFTSGRLLDTIIILQYITYTYSVSWTSTFHYLVFPETPIFLTSLLPKPWREWPLIYWGYSAYVTYYAFGIWQSIQLVTNMGLQLFLSILPPITREFRIGALDQKSKGSLRTVFNLTKEYRCVELNFRWIMEVMGPVVVIIHGSLSQFILVCNVSVIKYWDKMDGPAKVLLIVWSLVTEIVWIASLEMAGRFYEHSKKTLRSWKKINFRSKYEKSYLSKFRRACRPLKIGTPGMYTIKRLSVLKFMRGIIKGTFRALLTIK